MDQPDTSNVFLITGSDESAVAAETAKLVRHVAGEKPDPFLLDIVRERDGVPAAETVNQVIRSVLSPAFLPGRKTVWLQNFSGFDAEGTKDSRTPEAVAFRTLAELIAKGVPQDMALIMNGPRVDQRKALVRACKAKGKVMVLDRPDVHDPNWVETMRGLIGRRAADKGVRLPDEVVSFLVEILGTDTGRIDCELEKIVCFSGAPERPVTLEAAEAVCQGQGETTGYALGGALGARQVAEVLRVINVNLDRAKDPDGAALGLLMQAVSSFRQMLQVRIFMQQRRIRSAGQVMGAVQGLSDEERGVCIADGLEVAGFKPYRAKMLAEAALRYTGPELSAAMIHLRDAYRKCVSSGISARVVLEEVVSRIVGPGRAAT
jgi:DNA polymerase III delta subunit